MAKDFYIAAPWFTPEQLKVVEAIKQMFDNHGISYFSPKDECLFDPKNPDPEGILGENITAITGCKYVIAVTDGKDPGTLWECGYAYALQIPVVYVWLDHQPGEKFNLVLSASGVRVCMSLKDVEVTIEEYAKHRDISHETFIGDME